MTNRLLEIEQTGLFGEQAILTSLSGREEISRPFEFSLTIASPKENIKPEDVIGQKLAVRIDRDEEEPRYIHGYISHLWAGDYLATQDKAGLRSRVYRVRLVPWLWFMNRAARCFVYLPEKQTKTIQDVLDEIIKRAKSYGHIEPLIESGNASILKSRKVEHCVQYRESDFNFLSRTLERYGVYYYFKHEKDKHTMVLSDKSNYPNCIESQIEYAPSTGGQMNIDRISSWEHVYEFVSGKWEQDDYDFLHPSSDLLVNAKKHSAIPLKNNAGYELYDYTNDYVQKDDGRTEATRRMEEEEIRFNTVTGTSFCKTMTSGYVFKLTRHHTCPSEQGKSFLLTSVSHSASQPGPFTSDDTVSKYTNQFQCVPREMQYRPKRQSPQPLLSSIQTAVVVGPCKEEIYTENGLVKVQFHWDREGKKDENTSCWMRVSQEWAGKGWGGMQIPHVGHEVIVAFVEGDPDRPLIVGRVYNAEQSAPTGKVRGYDEKKKREGFVSSPFPIEKTQSVLRDYGGNETVTEGAEENQFILTKQTCGNEFLMDGKKGGEKIELRDKFENEIVLDAVKEAIKVSSPKYKTSMVVGNTETGGFEFKSEKDFKIKIDGDFKTEVVSEHKVLAGYSSKIIAGLKHETLLGGKVEVLLGGKVEIAVGYFVKLLAGPKYEVTDFVKLNTAFASKEKVKTTYKVVAGTEYSVDAGTNWKVKAGAEAKLEALCVSINALFLIMKASSTAIKGDLTVDGNIDFNNGCFKCKP